MNYFTYLLYLRVYLITYFTYLSYLIEFNLIYLNIDSLYLLHLFINYLFTWPTLLNNVFN